MNVWTGTLLATGFVLAAGCASPAPPPRAPSEMPSEHAAASNEAESKPAAAEVRAIEPEAVIESPELAESPSAETAEEKPAEAAPEEDTSVSTDSVAYEEGGRKALIKSVLNLYGVKLHVRVPQPAEGKPVVARLKAAGKTLKIGFGSGNYADYVQVMGQELKEFPGKRVAQVQIFLESGEDSFSRSMVTALVFLGNKKQAPKVLWQGEGSYSNYGGECEDVDVISFEPGGAGVALAMRHKEVLVPEDSDGVNGDAADCVAAAKTTKQVARVELP